MTWKQEEIACIGTDFELPTHSERRISVGTTTSRDRLCIYPRFLRSLTRSDLPLVYLLQMGPYYSDTLVVK